MPLMTLSIEDVARLFGAKPVELDHDLLGTLDPRYRRLSDAERDELLLRILKRIDSAAFPVSGQDRQPAWEQGWGENLQDFINSGYDVEQLVPKYFKKNVPVRLFGDYVLPADPDFVLKVTRLFRAWLFEKYLSSYDVIYEFGCGPATHLAWLAGRFPGKKLCGLDWARPSQEIVRLLAENRGWNISGRYFDLFQPDLDLRLDAGSAVYTFGALEQIGDQHGAFLDYLLRESPALCINVECIAEFYDQDSLPDYLALRYHCCKKYLEGYVSRLQALEREGRLEIITSHHQRFGNLFDDSHSYVIWRPTV